jgi:hypothetical protein
MRKNLVFALALALGVPACDKTASKDSGPAASAGGAAAATGAAPAAVGVLGPASLDVTWTGNWQAGDAPGSEFPVMRVVNKDATRPLTFYQGWFYFYDKDKKQVGRLFRERYQFSLEAGQTKEMSGGPEKKELPEGTEHMEFVVTGANFGSEADKFRVEAAPPETRPMGG